MAVEAAPIIAYKFSHDLNETGSYFYKSFLWHIVLSLINFRGLLCIMNKRKKKK
jgi:hypothetical protein